MIESEDWDLEIKPTRPIWDIGFKDIWAYRDLLILFVRRDIVSFYKQTILGPIWFLVQPLFTMTVYMFIFQKLAGLSTSGLPAPIFYLTGITFWTYFSQTLTRTANTLKENEAIFGKVYFPRIVMPLSMSLSNMFKLGIQFLLLVAIVGYYIWSGDFQFHFEFRLLLFPIFILCLAIQALGFGLAVTAMTTKYRDLVLLLTFGIQLLMYASPVVFPLESLEGAGKVFTLVSYNPVTYIFEGIRYSLFGAGYFSINVLLLVLTYTFLIITCGVLIFNKVERSFVDTI